ncbi:MAG: sulfite oxidase [Chloroflexi bacterium]|nr:sulfite oxidase [Chloroflexota bacterium]
MGDKGRSSTSMDGDGLWQLARAAGMPRRRFLALLAAGGAVAVLSACRAPTPTPPATATPVPTPTPTAAPLLSVQPPGLRRVIASSPPVYESPLELVRGLVTPIPLFFQRNHGATPRIDARDWRLRVEGNAVERPLDLSYDDILALPSRSHIRWVECAGNARSFFALFQGKPAAGGQWKLGAIGVAEWTGVPLAAVLDRAGVKRDAVDVLLEGGDGPRVHRPIPVEKARDPDTLLAYAMNGEALPPDHGFPLRAIVPGWVGVSNIKWLVRVEVSNQRIQTPFNTASYILDGPDYPDKPALTLQTLKSAVALPWEGTIPRGRQTIRGFAWSPHGRIARVEYSLDGGKTWADARLEEPNTQYVWVRWSFPWEATPGTYGIMTRATDEAGNAQPDSVPWNAQGYLYNAVVPHPVTVS